MTRTLPLAFVALGLAACAEPTEPADPLPLHVQGEVLSTAPPDVDLDGDDRLLPIVPGGTEVLWLYEIDPEHGVRPVDLAAVDYPDGLIEVIERSGNHAEIRAGAARAAGRIGLESADGRQLEVVLRVVPAVAARAVPGGAWTAGDPLLASSPFAVWKGGRLSVALLAAADDPDFRVIDGNLRPGSPALWITDNWDQYDVEAPAGRHTFEVRSNGQTLGFEVDVVDTIDRLDVIPSRTPQPPDGLGDAPFRVCVRASSGAAIVTGAFFDFALDGDGEVIRYPNVPANCAQVEMRSGAGMLRASLSGESMQIAVPAR